MSEMVERVARAIFKNFQETQDNHLRKDTWEQRPDLTPYHMAAARAAIAAMREPTEEMAKSTGYSGLAMRIVWQGMIDKVLAG